MHLKRRHWYVAISAITLTVIFLVSFFHILPLNIFSVQQKPEQAPQKIYDYYIIYDEKTNQDLMYVPLVVSIGDEVITEDNKRYRIVKIEENRAYARFIGKISQ